MAVESGSAAEPNPFPAFESAVLAILKAEVTDNPWLLTTFHRDPVARRVRQAYVGRWSVRATADLLIACALEMRS